MPHTKAALANKFDEWESYLGALKLPLGTSCQRLSCIWIRL